jgi:hypothetical protein
VTSATIDVLANDQATNPFPGQPLRVVDIRGLGGGGLPAGVSVTPSADNRTLSVSIAPSAKPGDTNLQYRVADVTDDPDRYVWGNVTISVQDVPDAPAAPVRTGTFTGGQLTLSYAAPQANNSPLTRFRLTGTGSAGGSYSKDCGLTTVCTLTDLDPEQTFRFSVVATNGIGDSAPSASSESYSADFVPAPPTGVTVTPSTTTPNELVVRWDAVPKPARGTSVLAAGGYVVEVSGTNAPGPQTVSSTTATFTGVPGSQYSVRVYAKNRAQVSSEADWARSAAAPGTAVGTPGPFSATATAIKNQVTVTWTASDAAGGTGVTYSVFRQSGTGSGAQGCSASGTPIASGITGTTVGDTPRDDGTYTYVVVSRNGLFCTSASAASESVTPPGQASASVAVEQFGNEGLYKARVTSVSAEGSPNLFQYRIGSGRWQDVDAGDFIESDAGDGVTMTLTFQACRVGATRNECGPQSDAVEATPVDTRATPTFCQVGEPLQADVAGLVSVDVRYRVLTGWNEPVNVKPGALGEVPPGALAVQLKGHAQSERELVDDQWRPSGSLLSPGFDCESAR